jgi:phosphoglycolate phosphatase
MVGDRMHDIRAAHANGLKSVGVLWGYGGEAELREAGADWLAATPPEVAGLV